MPRLLKDLQINEVSSVDRGAGRGVKVLLMKRDQSANNSDLTTGKRDNDMPTPEEVKKAAEDAAKAATDALNKAVGEAVAKALAGQAAEIAVLKMSDAEKAYCAGEKMTDDQQKSFAALKPEERQAKMKKADEDPVAKALAPVLTENTELKKRLTVLENDKTVADFKKRAVDLGLKEEDGEIMRKAYGGDAEAQKSLDGKISALTKQNAELIRTGKVFGEFGSSKGGGGSGTAYDEILGKAAELRKADPKLTEAQAFAKAYADPSNFEIVKREKAEAAEKRGKAALAA